ncbi:hypothetical protein GEMRC1_002854 [Eukaryota sp. GEM-RC1]
MNAASAETLRMMSIYSAVLKAFICAAHTFVNRGFSSFIIIGYMDNFPIIGPLDLFIEVAEEVADIYETLGLPLPDKCLLIGRSTQESLINGVQIHVINYVEDAFCFLGCWLGNVPEISQELTNCLENIGSELNTTSSV